MSTPRNYNHYFKIDIIQVIIIFFWKPSDLPEGAKAKAPKEITESKSIMEIASSSGQLQCVDSIGEPSEFVKCLERLILSTQTVDKHLENIQKPNKEFHEFEKQELKINAIKQTLESLAMALNTSLLHKSAILQRSDKEMSDRISGSVGDLTKRHQSCVAKFKEKSASYAKNLDKWVEFHANFAAINKWLDLTLVKFDAIMADSDLDSERIKEVIKVSAQKILTGVP